jgi:DNA segregation ATPase FtsK/SpoIIIE-like protein
LHGKHLAVPLGLAARQTIAGIDFNQSPHTLVIGPTRKGKITAMRALAYHLARQNHAGMVGLVAITLKPGDWQAFGRLLYAWAVVSDPKEAQAALCWLRDTMHRRTRQRMYLPHIFAFVDDLLNLLALADVTGPLVEIASLGRAAGIHLIIGTQRLGKRGAGDVAVTGSITTRLVFGTADAQDGAFFTGRADAGAERLGRYPGDALLINDGAVQRVAVARVTDQDLTELRQNAADFRPWLANRLEPAPERGEGGTDTAMDGHAARLVTGSNHLPYRSPTQEDAAAVRALYARTGSKKAALRAAYGGKNGQTLAWLNQGAGRG